MPRLGVIGTLVWDTIHPAGRDAPVEDWGGIAYSLSAFDAVAPPGWSVVPCIKVGADLREEADAFLDRIGRLDGREGVRTVPEPNNRVELRYRDAGRRCERLRGGVPGWTAAELVPLAARCDAVYVNFIAGWELDLDAARGLRSAFGGPLYADLHSLLLAVGDDGVRSLRPLPRARAWFGCFDLIQMNEDELRVLGEGEGRSPEELALEAGARVVFVTRGERGAEWVTAPGVRRLSDAPGAGAPRRGSEPVRAGVEGADPTGCGDVWGVACFTALLGGASVSDAASRATAVAARAAGRSGTSGLEATLAGVGGAATPGGGEGAGA